MNNKENEKNQIIRELEKKLNEVMNKYETLNENFFNLSKERDELVNKGKESANQISNLSNEIRIYKEELDILRSQNKSLDSTKFSQEKNINEYAIKNEHLMKQLEDKNLSIQNLNALVENLKSQKVK